MDTKETYVGLETAKMLKKAGFDWKINGYYWNDETIAPDFSSWTSVRKKDWNNLKDDDVEYISAPTLYLAQKWLREVKSCHVWVEPGKITRPETSMPFNDIDTNEWHVYIWFGIDWHWIGTGFTYEEALEAGINRALTIILEEKK